MIVSGDAIVLNSRKFGNSDKIVSVFSKEHGKVSLLAKGARKSKNKFGSSLDPMSYSEVFYYEKPGRDLFLLSKSDLIKPLRRIHESFDHISAGLSIAESVSQTFEQNFINEELFDILLRSMQTLNDNRNNPFSVFVSFQLSLSGILGFAVNTDDAILPADSEFVYFSIDKGCVSPAGSSTHSRRFRFDRKVFEVLKHMSLIPIEQSPETVCDQLSQKQLYNFFVNYFSFHLEKNFSYKTYKMLMI